MKQLEMGCYGLGVTRILATVAETSRDEKGMIWPLNIAPYKIIIVLAAPNTDTELRDKALEIYDLINRVPNFYGEVILDDRSDEKPGLKMRESLLLGIPLMVIVGENSRGNKSVELEVRKTQEKLYIEEDKLAAYLISLH